MDLLRSSRVGPNTTRVIAQLLSYVHPVQYTRVSFMEEIVSELREPPSPLNATFDESKSFPVQVSFHISLSNVRINHIGVQFAYWKDENLLLYQKQYIYV